MEDKRKIFNEQLPISSASPLKARTFDYKHFTYPWHFHPEFEIIYVSKGHGTRYVGNNAEKFSDGDLILVGSGLPHYMKSDEIYLNKNNSLRVKGIIIQFECQFMQYALNNYPQFSKIRHLLSEAQSGVHFPLHTNKLIVKLMKQTIESSGLLQITSFLELLHQMTENKSRTLISTGELIPLKAKTEARISRVVDFLNRNYTRAINLDEVATIAAMNSSAFCRYFKKETGKSLTGFVADLRINYACRLLLSDNKTISQISVESGFENISYFDKTFKKVTGHNPMNYKKIMIGE